MAHIDNEVNTPLIQQLGEQTLKINLETTASQVIMQNGNTVEAALTTLNNAVSGQTVTHVVNTIAERDSLTDLNIGDQCWVKDASADPDVESGAGKYIYAGAETGAETSWELIAVANDMGIVVNWDNIIDKPTSTVANIDDAVRQRHTHDNKEVLDLLAASEDNRLLYNNKRVDTTVDLTAINEELDSQKSTLDGHTAQLSAHQETLESHTLQLEAQQEQLDNHTTRLDNQKATLDDHTTQLETQQGQLDSQKVTLDGHTTQLAAQQSQLDDQKTTIDGHTTQLSAIEQEIADLDQSDLPATKDRLGVVRIGQGIDVDVNGVIFINPWDIFPLRVPIAVDGVRFGGSDGRRAIMPGETDARENWVECDGGTDGYGGTVPDLRGRMIMGASASYPAGSTGGLTTHTHSLSGSVGATTLSIQQMPNHNHGSGFTIDFKQSGKATFDWSGAAKYPELVYTGGSASHTHSILTTNTSTASNLPPYYALSYIMRVA